MTKENKVSTNKVRAVRKARRLTMAALADAVGVHFTTISKIEKGQRGLSGELLHSIATALNVAPEDLVDVMPMTVAVRMVPLIGTIAAGNWREAILNPAGHIPAPVRGGFCFALQPDDDSMDLVVGRDAVIVVDPQQLDLLDGKLYAIMNGEGETTFKRFRSDPPRLEPVSSNGDHQPIPLGREPFTVVGRVIWQGSSL